MESGYRKTGKPGGKKSQSCHPPLTTNSPGDLGQGPLWPLGAWPKLGDEAGAVGSGVTHPPSVSPHFPEGRDRALRQACARLTEAEGRASHSSFGANLGREGLVFDQPPGQVTSAVAGCSPTFHHTPQGHTGWESGQLQSPMT